MDGCVEPANVPPLPQARDGPQPPPAVEQGHGAPSPQRTPLVVVPRTQEVDDAEEGLQRALVAMIGGTRPPVSVDMVYTNLWSRFEIGRDDVEVRLHDPEDFIVRFRRKTGSGSGSRHGVTTLCRCVVIRGDGQRPDMAGLSSSRSC